MTIKIDQFRKAKRDLYLKDIDIVSMIKGLIGSRNIDFMCDSKCIIVQGVEGPLDMALEEFIENAIDNSPDKKCTIEAMNKKDAVEIVIKNKIIGPLPENLAKRLGKEEVESVKGGFGFHSSKKLIEENNKAFFKWESNDKKLEFSVHIEFLKKG